MDVDALARAVGEGAIRMKFASPPFPPYYPGWMERMRAKMPEEFDAAEHAAHPLETFDRTVHERIGDLDVYLYRVEPGAFALLLYLRADALAYVAFVGNWFLMPEDVQKGSRFPPFDLSMMAVGVRADAELGLELGGLGSLGDGPVGVAFEIERARYNSLGDVEREALHAACTPIARDAALLLCGRSAPLTIRFAEPDRGQSSGTDPHVRHFYVDTEKPGAERLIAEFDAP
jgi:hypothetical protein